MFFLTDAEWGKWLSMREEDSSLVGECLLTKHGYFLTSITKLYIQPVHRKKGNGSKLLAEAVRRCTTPCIIATVREDNGGWVETNRKLGFREVGRFEHSGHWVKVFFRTKVSMLDEDSR